ncbi:hypothetical protein ASF96_09140 [Microbacterium sp. Leaf179]|nr:hypothetical protein ASF96_09140 [Microbacterium sp. Leaf179]
MIAAKIAIEEQWAYDNKVARLSFAQMSRLAECAPAQGGLGYPIPASTLRIRAADYFTRIRSTLKTSVDERRARQEGEIDELVRLAVADIRTARAAGDVKASAEAEMRLLRYQEREAKIFGTDAPQRVEAEVTTKDAVSAELDAMLARLDVEKHRA